MSKHFDKNIGFHVSKIAKKLIYPSRKKSRASMISFSVAV